jgi:succinate dehydrogenase / fumarate reductase flavoprotein subunit
VDTSHQEFRSAEQQVAELTEKLMSIRGKRTVTSFHRELGHIVWDHCGMARNAQGLRTAIGMIQSLREEYWKNVTVPGSGKDLNQSLENAGRVADYFELAEVMCMDALQRNESCGGHFREEYQTPEGEALRDDDNFTHAAVWEYQGQGHDPVRHIEPLTFEYVHPSQRSYK